jgi:hypothetical protein
LYVLSVALADRPSRKVASLSQRGSSGAHEASAQYVVYSVRQSVPPAPRQVFVDVTFPRASYVMLTSPPDSLVTLIS